MTSREGDSRFETRIALPFPILSPLIYTRLFHGMRAKHSVER